MAGIKWIQRETINFKLREKTAVPSGRVENDREMPNIAGGLNSLTYGIISELCPDTGRIERWHHVMREWKQCKRVHMDE